MSTSPRLPRISVVIPVKDDAEHLERCLEALSLQTERPDEIVVVDNDSNDSTATVAERWGTVYVFEGRRGIAAAASAGYDVAAGGIIARLDADSMPPSGWGAAIRAAFDADPGLSAVTARGVFTSLPRPIGRIAEVGYMGAYFTLFRWLLGRPPLFGSTFAMRRSAWVSARDRIHRDDPNVHDDLDLSFALDRDARVVIDDALRVSISARPFANPLAFARRVGIGVRTVAVNRRRVTFGRR